MFEYFEGEVAESSPTRLVLDVGGVGYELTVPLGSGFPPTGRARAWAHLVVREDAQWIAGFPDRETRDIFRLLLSVRGVGATMALGILSGLPREPLLDAIVAGDLARLTRVRGVGKKTAEQILLDLREKATVHRTVAATPGAGTPGERPAGLHVEDAVAALISIGYSEKEARRNVERAARDQDGADLEVLVRNALAL